MAKPVKDYIASYDKKGNIVFDAKVKKFVHIYCNEFNATSAAIAIGVNEKSASRKGWELSNNTQIRLLIADELDRRAKNAEMKEHEIVSRLIQLATGNIKHLIDERGNIDLSNLTEAEAYIIKDIKVTESYDKDGNPTTKTEVKLHDKIKVLELLGKHAGMWKDRIDMGDGNSEETSTVVIQLPRGRFA